MLLQIVYNLLFFILENADRLKTRQLDLLRYIFITCVHTCLGILVLT